MSLFSNFYRGKRILVTGHTGFKGSWLTLWLQQLGADVYGVSLDPTAEPNHWNLLNLDIGDYRADIRDFEKLNQIFDEVRPELVFHLAAQSLVLDSYSQPLQTWSTNLMGSANLIEASRKVGSVLGCIIITTDKCYENNEWVWGYRETDALGGVDPYSASKAGVEILTASYRKSFFKTSCGMRLATARAGNVIGGGDWSSNRLIPDLITSIEGGTFLEIRNPNARRPWQHVLDCLFGYLLLGEKLVGDEEQFASAWNFGPDISSNKTVLEVLKLIKTYIPEVKWKSSDRSFPTESQFLFLDSTKSRVYLDWHPIWNFDCSIAKTAAWYRDFLSHKKVTSSEQLEEFVSNIEQSKITVT